MADQEQKASQKPDRKKRDEDPVGKVYDSRLTKRLAGYLKPYWLQAAVSAVAVSLKSVSDVSGPYLVMVGIDRYLTHDPGTKAHWLSRWLPVDPVRGITDLAALYLGEKP